MAYFIDIRCKVEAEDIDEAIKQMYPIEELVEEQDDIVSCFIKSIGMCLEDRNKMVGDVNEC